MFIKTRRTNGITTYDNYFHELSIRCSKKDGELFKDVASSLLSLKGNLDSFHKACHEDKLYVSNTDGTCFEGIYAESLEDAIKICHGYNALSIAEGNKSYDVWKYNGEPISSVLSASAFDSYGNPYKYNTYNILGCIFNPYAYSEKLNKPDGMIYFNEIPGIREKLEDIIHSNINEINKFLGYECDLKIKACWEDETKIFQFLYQSNEELNGIGNITCKVTGNPLSFGMAEWLWEITLALSNAEFRDEKTDDLLREEGYDDKEIERIMQAYPKGLSEDLITAYSQCIEKLQKMGLTVEYIDDCNNPDVYTSHGIY